MDPSHHSIALWPGYRGNTLPLSMWVCIRKDPPYGVDRPLQLCHRTIARHNGLEFRTMKRSPTTPDGQRAPIRLLRVSGKFRRVKHECLDRVIRRF